MRSCIDCVIVLDYVYAKGIIFVILVTAAFTMVHLFSL